MKPFFACLLLALSSGHALLAESDPSSGPPATFRLICASTSHYDLFYDRRVDGKTLPVRIAIDPNLSVPYVLPDKPALELYRMAAPSADSPDGSKPVRHTVLSAPLPAGLSAAIVIALPSVDGDQNTLQAHVLADDPDTHRAGMLCVVNCSKHRTSVTVDDQSVTLDPGADTLVKEGSGRVLFQVSIQQGKTWKSAFAGERRLGASLRGYLFIFDYIPDADYGSDATHPPVIVRTIFEIPSGTTTIRPPR